MQEPHNQALLDKAVEAWTQQIALGEQTTGFHEAAFNLADYHAVYKNEVAQFVHYIKLAAIKLPKARYSLGYAHLLGAWGFEYNPKKAKAYFINCAKEDHLLSKIVLCLIELGSSIKDQAQTDLNTLYQLEPIKTQSFVENFTKYVHQGQYGDFYAKTQKQEVSQSNPSAAFRQEDQGQNRETEGKNAWKQTVKDLLKLLKSRKNMKEREILKLLGKVIKDQGGFIKPPSGGGSHRKVKIGEKNNKTIGLSTRHHKQHFGKGTLNALKKELENSLNS